jgi:hypothetical protein
VSAAADLGRTRALVARYLDPRKGWSAGDETRARALREDPEARRAWTRAIALHRAMVGAPAGMPSGVELRRQAGIAQAAAGLGDRAPRTAGWWRILAPLPAIAAGVLIALFWNTGSPSTEWIKARGINGNIEHGPIVGIGVGGITDDGREYEAIASSAVRIDDWLRFSYTNERAEIRWLYLVGLQPDGDHLATRAIAPLPEEGRSVAISTGRFVQLPFETRLAARHEVGRLRLVALLTSAPLTVPDVERGLSSLASSAMTTLPSDLEVLLRERLRLSPGDVVQILDTHIVPGSAAPIPPPAPADGPRQETP